MRSKLIEKRKELDAKRERMSAVLKEAGDDLDMDKITTLEGDSAGKAQQIRTLHDEINDIGTEVDELAETVKMADGFTDLEGRRREHREKAGLEHPSDLGDLYKLMQQRGEPVKSFGELAIESEAIKDYKGGQGPISEIDYDIKAIMTTATGWVPETTRGPRLIDFVTRPIQVTDTIPGTTTNQIAIKYMQETTFTNAAAETAEGVAKPEAALALTEQTDPVRKIAVWIPVTDEQMEDVPQVQGYINNRLPFMVKQRLDRQILIGDGIAPNLKGITARAGIQTQAKGADPVPDAFYKALTKVMLTGAGNGGALPNVMYMNPLDWQTVRLLRTADGIYIWGSPSDNGPPRMWGHSVVLAEGLTQGTGLVGDTSYAELATKKGITLHVSDSHSDFFILNQLAIRAEMRAALVVYRPAAFCTVTGI
jgi:HK97 family phage major capsid protein